MQHNNKSVKIKNFEINNLNPFILIAIKLDVIKSILGNTSETIEVFDNNRPVGLITTVESKGKNTKVVSFSSDTFKNKFPPLFI